MKFQITKEAMILLNETVIYKLEGNIGTHTI